MDSLSSTEPQLRFRTAQGLKFLPSQCDGAGVQIPRQMPGGCGGPPAIPA